MSVQALRKDGVSEKIAKDLEVIKKKLSLQHQTQKDSMNGDYSERLSQESECRNEEEYGILERASAIALGVLKEIEALAGTTACKSVQLVRLKKWAQEQGCWFSDRTQFGEFFDRGSENETFLAPDQNNIIKLNDFRYSDDNLTSFFERIKAHNKYFDACPYSMIGFGENSDTGGYETYRSLSPRCSKT